MSSRSLVYDHLFGNVVQVRVYVDRHRQYLPVLKTLTKSVFSEETFETLERAVEEVKKLARLELKVAQTQLNKSE